MRACLLIVVLFHFTIIDDDRGVKQRQDDKQQVLINVLKENR
jgi:hypothetical protein